MHGFLLKMCMAVFVFDKKVWRRFFVRIVQKRQIFMENVLRFSQECIMISLVYEKELEKKFGMENT